MAFCLGYPAQFFINVSGEELGPFACNMDPSSAERTRQETHPVYLSNLPYEIATSQLSDLIRSEVANEPVWCGAFQDTAQLATPQAVCAFLRR